MNELTMTRKAIGRKTNIGSYYNALNDQLVMSYQSIFNLVQKKLDQIKCENYEQQKETFNCWHDCPNVFKTLQIEPDLTLSILSGLHKSSFSDYLLNLNEQSLAASDQSVVRFICHNETILKESRLSKTEYKARYCCPRELAFQATHVVVGIKLGYSIFVTFDYKIKKNANKPKTEIVKELGNIMKLVFDGKELSND